MYFKNAAVCTGSSLRLSILIVCICMMFLCCHVNASHALKKLPLDSSPWSIVLTKDTVFVIASSGNAYAYDFSTSNLLFKEYVTVPNSAKQLCNGMVVSSTEGLWYITRDGTEQVVFQQNIFATNAESCEDVEQNSFSDYGLFVLSNSILSFYPIVHGAKAPQPTAQRSVTALLSRFAEWSVELPDCEQDTVKGMVAGVDVYVLCNTSLYAIDTAKQYIKWRIDGIDEDVDSLYILNQEHSWRSGSTEQVEPWINETNINRTDKTEIVILRDGYSLLAINNTGNMLWKTRFSGVPMFVVPLDALYVWTSDGMLYRILANGTITMSRHVGEVSCMNVQNKQDKGHIIFCSKENSIGVLRSYDLNGSLEYVLKTRENPSIIDAVDRFIAYAGTKDVWIAFSDMVCTFFEPEDGSLIGNADVRIAGTVYLDNDTLKKMELYLDGSLLWETTEDVWEYYLDPRDMNDGLHIIECKIYGHNTNETTGISEDKRLLTAVRLNKNSEYKKYMSVTVSPEEAVYLPGDIIEIHVTDEYGRELNDVSFDVNGKQMDLFDSGLTFTLAPGRNVIHISREGYYDEEITVVAEEEGITPFIAIGLGLFVLAAILIILRLKQKERTDRQL